MFTIVYVCVRVGMIYQTMTSEFNNNKIFLQVVRHEAFPGSKVAQPFTRRAIDMEQVAGVIVVTVGQYLAPEGAVVHRLKTLL